MYKLYNGDCLEVMKEIEDNSVDMILCDLPYGVTACKWDSVIPFDKMWGQYKRIIKTSGNIVLFASQPFTSELILSNKNWFAYNWIWKKEQGTNFLLANKMPLKIHVISHYNIKGLPDYEDLKKTYEQEFFRVYNPQETEGKSYISGKGTSGEVTGNVTKIQTINKGTRKPTSILEFKRETGLHPTQKPVGLLEYLIKTYTNEGMTVLDNCMGSGSTGVACMNTNRRFIGIELDENYFNIAKNRIEECVK